MIPHRRQDDALRLGIDDAIDQGGLTRPAPTSCDCHAIGTAVALPTVNGVVADSAAVEILR